MNVSYWVVGLSILGISSILGGVNFITTIVNLRAPGMKLMRMPLFTWMTLVTSFILVTAIPVIAVALVLLTFDRFFAANFFVPGAGGDPVLWQHLFWIFGHPEVYILILPSFGVISDVIPTFSRKPLFGYPVVVYAGVLIGFIGWGVWSHHMFAAGLGPIADSFFLASTMIIAIPTAMKIFNWLATMWGGALRYTSAMLFAVGWHLPAAYDLALKHHSVHIVQHLMFISVAVMMWWPVVAPAPELERIPDGPLLMLYVFAFGIPMTILSAFLTMSDRLIYPYYALAPRVTSLGPLEDQQLGGLLMWIPGMLIFWVAITAIWFRWTGRSTRNGGGRPGSSPPDRDGGHRCDYSSYRLASVLDLYWTRMSLISFHRFLIATAIVFCFGFAIWELMTWWVGGEAGALTLGGTFIALGGVLTFYLVRLRRFLGVDPSSPGDQAPRTP